MLVRTKYATCIFFDFQLSFLTCSFVIQEEKLEPLKNTTDDPRIRLLNRLYAKKRKELRERERLKVMQFCLILCCSLAIICHTAECNPYP